MSPAPAPEPHAVLIELTEAVRAACCAAAQAAYEQAQCDGLCPEGAWECALDAMRSADLTPIIHAVWATPPDRQPADPHHEAPRHPWSAPAVRTACAR